jgi:cell shape-determining protein MreC
MATKTYSQEISDAQVMLSGIRTNQSVLAERKIDDTFTNELHSTIEACINLNNEQEQLKARLKEKTQELNERMTQLKSKTKEARKVIKMDMPQASWKEFGILDKR